ncbi:Autophagy-related protein 9 [Frankliniella fusca]|uniref:Autophagy-related protein 9 n=1 Tax=Frankliniella fusca TaxID=407009 RepID=A0AAE1GUB3_9NEOP|nr:Autophagy-related protein 9 [Frankliniella fusca]
MLWLPRNLWAPHFVVAVRSEPSFLIETALYCVVACFVTIAILVRAACSSRSLKGDGPTSVQRVAALRPRPSSADHPTSWRICVDDVAAADDDSSDADVAVVEQGRGDASDELTPPIMCFTTATPAAARLEEAVSGRGGCPPPAGSEGTLLSCTQYDEYHDTFDGDDGGAGGRDEEVISGDDEASREAPPAPADEHADDSGSHTEPGGSMVEYVGYMLV